LGRTGLSRKELSRVVMRRVKAQSLRLREAAEMLELSYRQAKRIWARYRAGGAEGSAAWELQARFKPGLPSDHNQGTSLLWYDSGWHRP
jgi:transposase